MAGPPLAKCRILEDLNDLDGTRSRTVEAVSGRWPWCGSQGGGIGDGSGLQMDYLVKDYHLGWACVAVTWWISRGSGE